MSPARQLTIGGLPLGTFRRVYAEHLAPLLGVLAPTCPVRLSNGPEPEEGDHWLVLIDTPERALETQLQAHESAMHDDFERQWLEAANELSKRLQDWEGPCLVLRAPDVEADPRAALARIARWCGWVDTDADEFPPVAPRSMPAGHLDDVAALMISDPARMSLAYGNLDVWVDGVDELDSDTERGTGVPSRWARARSLIRRLSARDAAHRRLYDECGLLHAQLQALHDDLLDRDSAEAVVAVDTDGPAPRRPARQVQIGAERVEGATRKLSLTVLGLHGGGGRQIERLELRLVEEDGRAGLMWLATPSTAPAFRHWRPTGRHGKTEFFVLWPTQAASQAWLDALGSSDWATLQAAVWAIEGCLSQEGTAPVHWHAIAQQLLDALACVPARLRHEPAEAVRLHEGGIAWSFPEVVLCGRLLGEWPMHWASDEAGRATLRIQLEATAIQRLPLRTSKAVGSHGTSGRCELPIRGRSWHADLKAWRSMPDLDRQVWLALLADSCQVLEQSAKEGGAVATSAAEAAQSLRPLHQRAIGLDALLRFGRGARAIRHAFGRRPSQVRFAG